MLFVVFDVAPLTKDPTRFVHRVATHHVVNAILTRSTCLLLFVAPDARVVFAARNTAYSGCMRSPTTVEMLIKTRVWWTNSVERSAMRDSKYERKFLFGDDAQCYSCAIEATIMKAVVPNKRGS